MNKIKRRALSSSLPEESVFIGQIVLMGTNFVPEGFLPCDGRLLPVQLYPGLFTVIGNTYGWGSNTQFALPDLRSRFPQGWAPEPHNPTMRASFGGSPTTRLFASHLPRHRHATKPAHGPKRVKPFEAKLPAFTPEVSVTTYDVGTFGSLAQMPAGKYLAGSRLTPTAPVHRYLPPGAASGLAAKESRLQGVRAKPCGPLHAQAPLQLPHLQVGPTTEPTGEGADIPLYPPGVTLNFVIAYDGVYPSGPV